MLQFRHRKTHILTCPFDHDHSLFTCEHTAQEDESVSILQELDLGCHTLFLMSDGSMDLLANDEQTPYLAENALHLDSEETYRLFISLHEQFKQREVCQDEQGKGTTHAVSRTACHRPTRSALRRDQ